MIQMPVEPQVTDYLHRKAAAKGIPLNGTFELTPCCNMACRMCYVRMTEQERRAAGELISAKDWLTLAEQAREKGMLYLLLTGGEPFLRRDIREIIEGLHQMGFVLTMNTNATLIDETVMEWLVKVPPTRMNITLYGASDATYERLCGNPRGFTQATHAIRLLKEAGINIKINCSVTPYNKEDLEELFEYCRREGLNWQPTSYMFPPLRRDEDSIGINDRFSPEEAAYYSAKLEALNYGKERYIAMVEGRGELPAPPMDDCLDTDAEGTGISCRVGRCCFWVTWQGIIMPCGMFPSSYGTQLRIGSESGVSFAEAWDTIHSQAMAIRLPAKCSSCELKGICHPCAAMCVTETGHFDRVPEYRCQMSQAYRDQCRILAEELKNQKE
ncbi:MAG: radical SAM protein [Lachnospiraceae bacterium]|nr:radical SAM protein [Lachnospiraceae bacterium]